MSAALAVEHAESPDAAVDTVDDAEFELDMRVVESATKLVIMMCDTSDGCGSTCSTSACSTGSNDPF
ncbi:FxLD family lantipeptide [Kibdelosporangium banguiense]|uniref:FxLD family lantipeptide n=1 Tax=Kibdelosporangium banguiense TaxID=1365924 RepID=A0ABS4TH87_9PSEU|nr:FxLD family lanthipeptide [Kibdelosporangium banguiense]MBP2323797.1 FxLD family lantipeptide [Kibdelosporangium banguiense]